MVTHLVRLPDNATLDEAVEALLRKSQHEMVGGLAAAGYRIATSGAAERQGVVHRLDVGTSGLMVVAKSEYAYSWLKQAFRDRTVDKTYHALVQGHPDPLVAPSTRRSGATPRPTTSGRWSRAASPASPTTRSSRRSPRPASSRSTSRPGAPTRSACTSRRSATRASVTSRTARTRAGRAARPDPAVAARLRLGFTHPGTDEWVEFTSSYPPDLATALERLVPA